MKTGSPHVIAATRVGFWASAVAAGSSIAFSLASLLILPGFIKPPWDAIASLPPSLVLAPAFMVALICADSLMPIRNRIWTRIAVAFATAYVPLVSAAYVVELLVVQPFIMRGEGDKVALLTLSSQHSVFNAIDGFGYVLMGLATLFAAPAFSGNGVNRWIRGLFLANAVLIVPVVLTYFVDRWFIYLAMPWAITVPGLTILLAVFFKRGWHPPAEPRSERTRSWTSATAPT